MILVLNCGSQTIKYEIFEPESLKKKEGKTYSGFVDYNEKIKEIIEDVTERFEITSVGHRVVHGGEFYFDSVVIDEEVLKEIKNASKVAPLHNPYNLMGIKEALFRIKKPSIAVFDTGFYKDLPEKSKEYAISKEVSKEYGIRKYGFHGISHRYVFEEVSKRVNEGRCEKVISCHLGGGSSITAIKNGEVIDTSMGLTPLEGLVMMTRGGDIDPGVILHLCREMGVERTEKLLNNDSGMFGLCGESNMLKILEKVKEEDELFVKAFDIYIYRIKKYIGSYIAALGGCDALIFTGGVGAGDSYTRKSIYENMENILNGVRVFVIPANEGLMIAREVIEVISTSTDPA